MNCRLARGIRHALNQAADYESALAELHAVSGIDDTRFREEALALAKSTPLSVEEALHIVARRVINGENLHGAAEGGRE